MSITQSEHGPAAAGADPAAADPIVAGRARIDALDAEIVRLVRERAEVSRGIQRARLAGGGARIEHSREMRVITRYAEALGRPGTALAMALLELCRGAAGAGAPTPRRP